MTHWIADMHTSCAYAYAYVTPRSHARCVHAEAGGSVAARLYDLNQRQAADQRAAAQLKVLRARLACMCTCPSTRTRLQQLTNAQCREHLAACVRLCGTRAPNFLIWRIKIGKIGEIVVVVVCCIGRTTCTSANENSTAVSGQSYTGNHTA